MKKKNVIMNEHKLSEDSLAIDSEKIMNKLREINISDKWIYDKAVKAFVSFIRFYLEHDLKYIFDIRVLDVGNVANSYQLLRLPRMKEILGKKVENFKQDEKINPNEDLEYLDGNIRKQMEEKQEY